MQRSNHQRLVFIGGIHGVGKTSLCQKVAASSGALHLSAGELIRTARGALDLPTSGKTVKDAAGNQDLLLHGLATRAPSGHVILDGHFALLGLGAPTRVPLDTFRSLAPAALALLLGDIRVVAQRLFNRDQKRYDIAVLEELQLEERAAALECSNALNVPLKIGIAGEQDAALATFIEAAIGNSGSNT